MPGPTSHSLTLWRCQHTPTVTCQAPPPTHSLAMSAYTNSHESDMQGPTSHSLTLWRCQHTPTVPHLPLTHSHATATRVTLWRCQHTPTAMRVTCKAPPPTHSLAMSAHTNSHESHSLAMSAYANSHESDMQGPTSHSLTPWRCQHTPTATRVTVSIHQQP